jgi:hypothetical protein
MIDTVLLVSFVALAVALLPRRQRHFDIDGARLIKVLRGGGR